MGPPDQIEPMQAWIIVRWFEPITTVVVIGTRADAEDRAESFEADGYEIQGPYEYSIAIRP